MTEKPETLLHTYDKSATVVFEDLACVRQKRKFWSRVNYQETFAHTRILFGHVRARVVYNTSRDFRYSLFYARS